MSRYEDALQHPCAAQGSISSTDAWLFGVHERNSERQLQEQMSWRKRQILLAVVDERYK